jgi:hypothetical protein
METKVVDEFILKRLQLLNLHKSLEPETRVGWIGIIKWKGWLTFK